MMTSYTTSNINISPATRSRIVELFVFVCLVTALIGLPVKAIGAEKPLWELGIGAGLLFMPDYRGSDETRAYLLPFPYAVYRGGILRVEDKRITGRLFTSDRVTLDASGYGAVPVPSKDNRARAGMQDLDPTFEVGPSLRIRLYDSPAHHFRVSAALPVRAMFSTDFSSVRYEGWVFSPRLNFEKGDLIPDTGIYLGLSAGPMFGDRRYHDYFYEVQPAYARFNRPAYSASGGYSGSTLTLGLGKNFNRFIVHAFVSADFLEEAAFADSPLVKTRTSLMGGMSVSWVFLKSKKTVTEAASQ